MFFYKDLFKSRQRTVEVSGTIFGGFPGVNPVVLIGSLFYHGDKLLVNEDEGVFLREDARKVVGDALDVANRYGVGFGLDVIIATPRAAENILPFIAEFDLPLFLDSPDPGARIKAYSLAAELGIVDRVVANGIYVNTGRDEIEAIRSSSIKNGVILVFDPANPAKSMMPEDRIVILEEKLLKIARDARLENLFLDAVVLDPASIAFSAETILLFKEKYGYPSGCAPSNAIGVLSKKIVGYEEYVSINTGVAVYLRLYGADYIMYGPVKRIKYIAPGIAMIDALLGYTARYSGARLPKKHPIKTILKKVQKIFAGGYKYF